MNLQSYGPERSSQILFGQISLVRYNKIVDASKIQIKSINTSESSVT